MTTWIEQRVDVLEARLADLSKQMRGLAATEIMLAGAGDPNVLAVIAVQGTHYWNISNQREYINVSVGPPPEGALWLQLDTV